jgi:hypothetical protein
MQFTLVLDHGRSTRSRMASVDNIELARSRRNRMADLTFVVLPMAILFPVVIISHETS